MVGCCESGNEPAGAVSCGEFLVYLRACYVLHGGSSVNLRRKRDLFLTRNTGLFKRYGEFTARYGLGR